MPPQKSTHKWRWSTRLALFFAGWRRNRNVWHRLVLPESICIFPEAKRVLSSYGKLGYGSKNASYYVRLDPMLAEANSEQIKAFVTGIGMQLYPLGLMVIQDDYCLLVAENGVAYTLHAMPLGPTDFDADSVLEPLALTFEKALDHLFC